MPKILSIFGTRPEAIKMAPVIKELEESPNLIMSRVCVTAQHRQMLDQVLGLFEIVPDYDLDLMRSTQSPTQVATAVLASLEPILQRENPDWVLVHGDTTTTMAAALAGFYAGVRVGHVEAGLRTANKRRPFPEELNRRIVSGIADLHFAPTQRAFNNLRSENVPIDTIFVTGNTVIDALQMVEKFIPSCELPALSEVPADKRILLVTVHRRENLGHSLELICKALRSIASTYRKQVHLVFPVHLNPRVQQPVHHFLDDLPNVTLMPPLDYLSFIHLLKRSYLVLTDSGGLQEEAPSFGKPVLVLREETERVEAVEAGTVKLVGSDDRKIFDETAHLLDNPQAYAKMSQAINPYGDGQAAKRIVAALIGKF